MHNEYVNLDQYVFTCRETKRMVHVIENDEQLAYQYYKGKEEQLKINVFKKRLYKNENLKSKQSWLASLI